MRRHLALRVGGALALFALCLGPVPLAAAGKGRRARSQAAPQPPPAAEDPSTSPAWRHFSTGRDMVNAGRLSDGVAELRAARAAPGGAPPDTDFYLGLAHDGLRQTEAALAAYRRYLAAHPNAIHSESVRERIKLIELRRSLQQGQKQP